MTAGRRRVALVAHAGDPRTALADYLTRSGFDVHACAELAAPSAFAAVVLLGRHDEPIEDLTASVRAWMKLGRIERVVVVTSKPRALAELAADHGERLRVLPAPVFGWDLVDALRAGDSGGPGRPTRPGGPGKPRGG